MNLKEPQARRHLEGEVLDGEGALARVDQSVDRRLPPHRALVKTRGVFCVSKMLRTGLGEAPTSVSTAACHGVSPFVNIQARSGYRQDLDTGKICCQPTTPRECVLTNATPYHWSIYIIGRYGVCYPRRPACRPPPAIACLR